MTETAKVEETNGKHAENGEMSELDKSINKQVMLNRFLQSSRILVHLSRRFFEFITWTA